MSVFYYYTIMFKEIFKKRRIVKRIEILEFVYNSYYKDLKRMGLTSYFENLKCPFTVSDRQSADTIAFLYGLKQNNTVKNNVKNELKGRSSFEITADTFTIDGKVIIAEITRSCFGFRIKLYSKEETMLFVNKKLIGPALSEDDITLGKLLETYSPKN